MKIIHLTEEAEKVLSQIVDHALKAGGLAVHGIVNQLISHIKDVPDAAPKEQPSEQAPQ